MTVQRIARLTSAMIAALAVVLMVRPAIAAESVPGEYLVKYKTPGFMTMSAFRSVGGMRVMSDNPTAQLIKITVAPGHEVQTFSKLLSNSNVDYIVPNIKLSMFRAPLTAQALREQWALKKVRAQDAWTRAGNKGSHNVLVAVIDTGADYNHESLKPNMVPGHDFKDNTEDPMDQTQEGGNPGHGTHCSGIIGGTGLVDGGIEGISPEVSIMPLRFLGPDGSGDLDSAIKAIDYAIAHKVQVISASWGATVETSQAQPLIDAVKRAADAGVIFVAAAANDGADNDSTSVYPANAPGVAISVAASDASDAKPSWSNFGRSLVHLASPGDGIVSTLPKNQYGPLSGTSMATPLVSGLVAFLKAQDADLTGAQVRALLQLTGAKVDIETACNCRVDAFAAVDALMNKKMFITPAAATVAVGATLPFTATFGQAPLKFQVADASVASISEGGTLQGLKEGTTSVTVTDSKGQTSTSLDIRVGAPADHGGGGGGGGFPTPPGGGGGGGGGLPTPPGGGGSGSCPLGDQATCDQICQAMPTLPFCKH